MEKDVVWVEVKEELRNICKPVFYKKFLSNLEFKSFNKNILILSAASKQIKQHIEMRYLNDIVRLYSEKIGIPVKVKISTVSEHSARSFSNQNAQSSHLPSDKISSDKNSSKRKPLKDTKYHSSEINPVFNKASVKPAFAMLDNKLDKYSANEKYVFDDFVRGSCNELAYQACKRVQDTPGNAYNPLYIYGQPGLGKTHLLHATANAIHRERPWVKIVYLTMDEYTSLWVQSIRNGTHETFKAKIRSVDVLLLDDIHSLNKNATNTAEELFNTFNHLHSLNKQILLTSDRTPAELNVEERLRTRFGWGLITELTTPDFETRKIIFKKKAEKLGMELPENILDYLAENLDTNIRFLESAINKLHATSSLLHTPIDLNMTMRITKGIIKVSPKTDLYTFNRILKAVSKITEVNEFDILGKSRIKTIAEARHLGMFLSAKFCNMSKKEIAKKFGRSDHTTVINAEKNINKKLQSDPNMQIIYDEIVHQLKLG